MDERNMIDNKLQSQIDFPTMLAGVKNYDGILTSLKKTLTGLKEAGIEKIGFVSGPIANTPEVNPKLRQQSIKEKMERMRRFTSELRIKYQYPLFSSTDIFDVVWNELEETSLPREERSKKMQQLFREILRSGFTDIFMMPGWRDSPGAVDEYETAKLIGIKIHDLDEKTEEN